MKLFMFVAFLTIVNSQALLFKPKQNLQKFDGAAGRQEDRPAVRTIQCPGNSTTQCPDNTTCCQIKESGGYWCCRFQNAQCCNTWCCAEGKTCLTAGQCSSVDYMIDTPLAKQLEKETSECPGGQGTCDQGSTCCVYSRGETECCPLSDAVCCSDKKHCCPRGTLCDVSSGKCLRGPESDLNWLLKELAGSARSNVGYTAMRPRTQAHKVGIFRQPYAIIQTP